MVAWPRSSVSSCRASVAWGAELAMPGVLSANKPHAQMRRVRVANAAAAVLGGCMTISYV